MTDTLDIEFPNPDCRKPHLTKRQLLEAVLARLDLMSRQMEKLMSGVTDLQAAVASIATDLTAENAVIQQVITALQAGGLSDADAEALAVQLQGSATNITQATTSLQNALTPPPAPGTPAA